MKVLARLLAVATMAIGSVATGSVAHANNGPVPEEWGPPLVAFAGLEIVGRENGRLPSRLGNQHVTLVNQVDEDSVISGSIVDWWCPSGALAPYDPVLPTTCRLKTQYEIAYDYPRVEHQAWDRRLTYLDVSIPIKILDSDLAVVQRGRLTYHVEGMGATTNLWSPEGYEDRLTRHRSRVTGGGILGTPWLTMSSVEVVDGNMWLLRTYDPR